MGSAYPRLTFFYFITSSIVNDLFHNQEVFPPHIMEGQPVGRIRFFYVDSNQQNNEITLRIQIQHQPPVVYT